MREKQTSIYERSPVVTIADQETDVIFKDFPFRITLEGDRIFIVSNGKKKCSSLFWCGEPLDDTKEMDISFLEGGYLEYDALKLIFGADSIQVITPVISQEEKEAYPNTLLELAPKGEHFPGFPRYKRSPRLIKRIPDKEIRIQSPTQKGQMKKSSLIQLIVPTLVMAAVTVMTSALIGGGAFMIASIATTLVTLVFSIVNYVNDLKDCKVKNARCLNVYEEYLLDIRKELNRARNAEMDAWNYNYPSVQEVEKMAGAYSERIYERSFQDEDFLTAAVGRKRDQVSFKIEISERELGSEKDELETEAMEIKNQFSRIDRKPVVADLKKAHLGLVGEKENIHEQLKIILSQLTFQQSYHDLQIIMICHEKYKDDFAWMRWYPHLKIKALNLRGMIHSEQMRDQVLGSMTQILKERQMKLDEKKNEARFAPHFLFVIDEPKLVMDHAVMEYLAREGGILGFSLIYTTHMRANLPEHIGTVLLLEDSRKGKLLLKEKKLVEEEVNLEQAAEVDLEWMARNLSVLIHEQGITSRIPERITFFDMYQVGRPQDLGAKERWHKNESHKTLAVPLGLRTEHEYVSLNLHEKAHGPHGLVAGTTGSGKSEIIQSYILSLAVNFHPYEVGFLLIDYKGGGMAGLFKNLPHLLGTITNLDGSESQRAMASIKSELARRQRIFSENKVNHINGYHKLFKNGGVKEPIPHLFLISDEFAELKKEQPDFMAELVSTARIGRSLGIHLILATQKPSGVVDDQIWTNSKFKLALKVQDEADSREILKTGDAAFITQAGRAYLQVGNNEIYELFQSAWSGAVYSKEEDRKETDTRVYLVNELGQGELLNEDLSTAKDSNQSKATQLDVVVAYLQQVFTDEGGETVKKPWLPSVPAKLLSPLTALRETAVTDMDVREAVPGANLCFELGLVDIPEAQTQQGYEIDLKKDGNTAYFASAGYGKSVMLTTCILSLAMKNKVSDLNFYLLDFGSSALITLDGLPHTADYITFDDGEKMEKFLRLIGEEIRQRRKLLMEKMAQNVDVYNQLALTPEERLKAIVIIVDNFDVVKELGFDTEEEFTRLSRDGSGLGIYMIISASQEASVRYATLNNFKVKIAGYLYDPSEATGIVGRSEYKLPEVCGRSLVKLANVNIMQIYTMVEFRNEIEYNTKIRMLVEEIVTVNPGAAAPRIPVLPDKFEYAMLADYEKPEARTDLILGLDVEQVALKGSDRMNTPFIIIGDTGKGKTNALRMILNQLKEAAKVYLFDSKAKGLYAYRQEKHVAYVRSEQEWQEFTEDMKEMCEERERAFEEAIMDDPGITAKEFYRGMAAYYVVIEDAEQFVEHCNEESELEEEMPGLLGRMADTGISIYIAAHSEKLRGYDDLTSWIKGASNGLVLSDQGSLDIFTLNSYSDLPDFGDGLLFANGLYKRIRIPQCGA